MNFDALTEPVTMSHANVICALRIAKGWLREISRETGVSYLTLRAMAQHGLDPRAEALEKISVWFTVNGVPDCHPLRYRARQRKAAQWAASA